MIRAEDIPDEVVVALKEYFDTSRTSGFLREVAAAMLNAWPGVSKEEYVTWPRGKLTHLILPLPPKKGEA